MIDRVVLRDAVRQHLFDLMLSGQLALGDRIPLAWLARSLEVSVTPVREALSQLEHAGIVTSIPNRGFFIGDLSAEEAREIYPIIASLEAMMVRETEYSPKALQRLTQRQADLEAAEQPLHCVRADLAFHAALLQPCTNRAARRIVDELKVRVFFYEVTYWTQGNQLEDSVGNHHALLEQLAAGDRESAAATVAHNWLTGLLALNDAFEKSLTAGTAR